MTQSIYPRSRLRSRRGLTMIETIVSASILVVVMCFGLSLTFRISQVWRDTTHQRIAMNELSNQLDELTRLPVNILLNDLEVLEVSSSTQRIFEEPVLVGRFVDDELGKRIVLSLHWKQRHPGIGAQLVGWLVDQSSEPGDKTQSANAPDVDPAINEVNVGADS